MRNTLIILFTLLSALSYAQKDDTTFRAYLYNNTYDIFLRINLYEQDITIPGQELYGPLPGYLGKHNNSFCWVITSADIKSEKEAELSLINDYGSDDLTATLTCKNDSVYILQQRHGSTLKVPKNGKWQKLPKVLELKKRKK